MFVTVELILLLVDEGEIVIVELDEGDIVTVVSLADGVLSEFGVDDVSRVDIGIRVARVGVEGSGR